MASIATFVSPKTDKAMKEKKYSVAYGSKQLMDNVQTIIEDGKSLLIRSDSGTDKLPLRKFLNPCSKRFPNGWRIKDVK